MWTITTLIFLSPLVHQQSEPNAAALPPAEEILDRFVEVTGGQAYKKIRNRHEVYEIRTSYDQQVINCVHDVSAPQLVRGKMQNKNGQTTEYGFLRGNSWLVTEQGPSWRDGEERKWEALYANFDLDSNWRAHFAKVDTVTKEPFEGKECYKVHAITKSDLDLTLYFEVDPGLRRGIEVAETRRGQSVSVTRYFSDWRKVDGILIPHACKSTFREARGEWSTYSQDTLIEHNVDFPADHFEPPALMKTIPDPKEQEDQKPK
jgi:hypothetical protein